jgi:hypothetical protein
VTEQPIDQVVAALLEAAGKATPGNWKSTEGLRWVGTPNHMSQICECRDQNGNWTNQPMAINNAGYIALANPSNITRLCGEINRLQAKLEALTAENGLLRVQLLHVSWFRE